MALNDETEQTNESRSAHDAAQHFPLARRSLRLWDANAPTATKGNVMAISVFFRPTSFTQEQYEEALKQLEAMGQAAPRGRLFHACSGTGDKLTVFDIWESQEAFDEFGNTLMPILDQMEVDPGIPGISALNNVIRGSSLKDGPNK
jgi:hypothetical protein